MNKIGPFVLSSFPIRWIGSLPIRVIQKKSLGLKAKITFFIILNVAGVLFFSSTLDFHLSKKAQISLFLDRNLSIA